MKAAAYSMTARTFILKYKMEMKKGYENTA